MPARTTSPADLLDQADAIEHAAGLLSADDLAVIAVHGEDAETWLQGQVTQDVAGMAPGDARYALIVDLKGRVIADPWVLRRSEGYWLVVSAGSAAAIVGHLDGFVVMDDVEIELETGLAVVEIDGPAAAGGGDALACAATNGAHAFVVDRLGLGGAMVITARDEREAIATALLTAMRPAGAISVTESAWDLVRLRRGIPRFGVDFDRDVHPQEAGLERSAVSFDKGCYIGQEAVCMLQMRGKVRQRMCRFTLASLPAQGESRDDLLGGDAKVGRLTSVVADPAGGVHGLGYVGRNMARVGAELLTSHGIEVRVESVVGDDGST